MLYKKATEARLSAARENMSVAATRLDDLRSDLMRLETELREPDASDPNYERDSRHRSQLITAISAAREVSLALREASANATVVEMTLLGKAGVGVSALALHVVLGVATGAADAYVTDQVRERLPETVEVCEAVVSAGLGLEFAIDPDLSGQHDHGATVATDVFGAEIGRIPGKSRETLQEEMMAELREEVRYELREEYEREVAESVHAEDVIDERRLER